MREKLADKIGPCRGCVASELGVEPSLQIIRQDRDHACTWPTIKIQISTPQIEEGEIILVDFSVRRRDIMALHCFSADRHRCGNGLRGSLASKDSIKPDPHSAGNVERLNIIRSTNHEARRKDQSLGFHSTASLTRCSPV